MQASRRHKCELLMPVATSFKDNAQAACLAVHHVDLRAVVVVDAGKFEGDVAAADAGQPLGHRLQVEDLIARDGVLCSRDWDLRGTSAHSQQDVLCLQQQYSKSGLVARSRAVNCRLQVRISSWLSSAPGIGIFVAGPPTASNMCFICRSAQVSPLWTLQQAAAQKELCL